MAGGEQIRFNILRPIWRLNRSMNGWQKEVNFVSWNGGKPKLDIREWNADKTMMRKGLTFSKDELSELKRCMYNIDPEEMFDYTSSEDMRNKEPGPAQTTYSRSSTGNENCEEVKAGDPDVEEVKVCGRDDYDDDDTDEDGEIREEEPD